ncbi:ribosome recycling factor [Aspergillus sclerotioniger CBS 115572]|uniref:Ribosome recycling factor n=1 Tax=Aspergillus sclerotioniger CBS 115572 TaxID=1450535 RepID=A0A317VHA8_9EURO|nr:ribosome recycling factor [Aspergillus sclerotioniger CBS 115572]PWY72551.1 ribosome recycling factor [Aspergillus sclerotioniger CBS 115572]
MQCYPAVTRFRCWPVLHGFRPNLFSEHQIPRWSQYRPVALHKNRRFSTSPFLYKKKKKEKTRALTGTDSGKLLSKAGVPSEDPHDFSQLHDGIAAALSRLRDDLSKLRVGGRFNTGSIENLRVQLSKGSKETVRLGDLAQVVPKSGRIVTILASEDDHVKPITSSIISSNLSLNPQPDPHNGLQLNITIPPPTKESRDQTITIAKAAMEKAAGAVRDSRGAVHKRLQDLQKKKIVRPGDVRKAQEQMEKLTEKGQKDLKELFQATRKAMERV